MQILILIQYLSKGHFGNDETPPMVIVKLYGGLANQMFQYAAGKALSEKMKTKVHLDLSWFDNIKGNSDVVQRVFELDGFGIQSKPLGFFARRKLAQNRLTVFTEEGYEYQQGFDDLRGDILLDGYWQSFLYFKNYEDEVREAFAFKRFPEGSENQKLLTRIARSSSVSIHVRRGDYNTKRGRSFHGLLGIDYYKRAVDDLKAKMGLKNIELFLFSDEIEWCKKNLTFDIPTTYVDSNSLNKGVDDMQLMAACDHNIIANSSFSWWAAWLNNNPSKIVYAPAAWFVGKSMNTKDLIPIEWQKI